MGDSKEGVTPRLTLRPGSDHSGRHSRNSALRTASASSLRSDSGQTLTALRSARSSPGLSARPRRWDEQQQRMLARAGDVKGGDDATSDSKRSAGVADDDPVSVRVRVAVRRFKGDRSRSGPSMGESGATDMATLVGAALERRRMLSRVKAGIDAVKVEEDKTGEPLLGDENTQRFEVLRERRAAEQRQGSTAADGVSRMQACHLSARYHTGNIVTHAAVRYTIIALIILDCLLFLLEINGVLDNHKDVLRVVEIVVVWVFVTEVGAKIFAFHKDFFSSWWNIFDFIIVLISVLMLLVGVGLDGIMVGRSLKLFGVAHRSLRVLRIVVKVYSQGSSLTRRDIVSHAYPIEQVVAILHKVRFSSALSRHERSQISFLVNSLVANTLYIPNLDDITSTLGQGSQVPDWIESNFNSKPKATSTSNNKISRQPSLRLRRRIASFSALKSSAPQPTAAPTPSVSISTVASMLDDELDTWGFDVFEFDKVTGGWPLFHLFLAIVQWHGLCDEVGCSMQTVTGLAKSIESQYHKENSYHSGVHGADVLQTVHVLLTQGRAGQRMEPVQRLSMLLAAAAHDVGHPGLSNNFLVATGATEALLRNDQSVLEHMHSYLLFKSLRRPSCNVFAGVAADVYKAQRRMIIRCILGTDLAQHFELVGQFKSNTATMASGETVADWDVLQMVMVLKMADISHPTKPWLQHSQWTQRCMVEFYQQGDMEKKLGLPVSPLMDRNNTNVPSAQVGFIKVLVAPLFNAWAEANIQLGWCHHSSAHNTKAASNGPHHGQVPPPVTTMMSDGDEDPLQLLHDIDELLTTNLERWEGINNGDIELEWDMDVCDAGKWHEMSVRLEQLLNPSVYNTSKYINLSGVEMRSSRQFHILDGAAALESPHRSGPATPKPHISSPLVRNGAGAGAGAGSGSGGTMSTDVGSSGNNAGGSRIHARVDSIEDVELGVATTGDQIPRKGSRVAPAPAAGHASTEFRKESPVRGDGPNGVAGSGSRPGWSHSNSNGSARVSARVRADVEADTQQMDPQHGSAGSLHGPTDTVVSVPGQLQC